MTDADRTDRELPGLDLAALEGYLREAKPGLVAGPLSAELIAGGRSNLTYYLTDGTSRWVLRRPPLGHVLATAHDMSREYRVLRALAGTDIPVPGTVALCTDPEPLGAPFYLMERVDGVVLRSFRDTERIGPAACEALGHQLVDVLADLHNLHPEQVGLGDFGRPEGYLTRQVSRWRKQLDSSRSREVDGIDELYERLADSVPTSQRHSLLHGDFRLDNVLVTGWADPADQRITAVLDWEMATLGDPLADLGLFVIYSRGAGKDDPVTGGVTSAPGFPPIDEQIARYADRTGTDVSDLDWYVGLASFKLAVVLEGIYYRFMLGKTIGPGFDRIGALVPGLVRNGLDALDS
ncbi:MAG TPA: phosphotransferase family protein [Pseudonocardiaceae bacterium]|jgi:aminoglycoside phosphotransferase (APT) family kinase protein|nr:phosphotransferase family protein [Pseudonocardiaceae bacterium]